ncbi:hypothetical protein ABMA32_20340 [Mesorhizobium sp. VNQ89]
MHPVKFLFDEINRDYWGLSPRPERASRKHRQRPAWRLPRFLQEDART